MFDCYQFFLYFNMSWSTDETAQFALYYIIAVISIVGNLSVVVYLLRVGQLQTPFTFIILALHSSIFLEGLATMPYMYVNNHGMCIFMELLHYYSVLLHVFSITMMVQIYRANIFDEFHWIKQFVIAIGPYILIMLPLIALFRLLDSAYDQPEYPWCIAHSIIYNPIYFCTYFFWIWAGLFLSTVRVIESTIRIYRMSDKLMAWKFFCSIGLYTTIALYALLVPTIIAAMHSDVNDDEGRDLLIGSTMPSYIAGILYVFIFFRDREKLEKLEEYHLTAGGEESTDQTDTGFHFRKTDIMSMLDERMSESTQSIGLILTAQTPAQSQSQSQSSSSQAPTASLTMPKLNPVIHNPIMTSRNNNNKAEMELENALRPL